MSVREREQALPVHRERRMAIMIAANAALSTKGANHDIMSVSEREHAMLAHRERRMAIMIAAYTASSTKGANHDIMQTIKFGIFPQNYGGKYYGRQIISIRYD